jgi:hypothetical protein
MMAPSLVGLAGWGLRFEVSNHRVHYAGLDPNLQARCSCKKRSEIGSRSTVEDWFISHLQEIERIRAHLGSRTPSLRSQWAWFQAQAEDETNDPEDRALWGQLADELDRFISARGAPLVGQDTLF